MHRTLVAIAVAATSLGVAGSAQGALVSFRSPSGNIGCVGSNAGKDNYVRCDVRRHRWAPPAQPKWCKLDWGSGFVLGRRGIAHWVCAGDTALGSRRVLAYGRSIKIGRIRCRSSRAAGITCRNRWGYSFRLSSTVARRYRVLPAS